MIGHDWTYKYSYLFRVISFGFSANKKYSSLLLCNLFLFGSFYPLTPFVPSSFPFTRPFFTPRFLFSPSPISLFHSLSRPFLPPLSPSTLSFLFFLHYLRPLSPSFSSSTLSVHSLLPFLPPLSPSTLSFLFFLHSPSLPLDSPLY
jgi:hypothetical protein